MRCGQQNPCRRKGHHAYKCARYIYTAFRHPECMPHSQYVLCLHKNYTFTHFFLVFFTTGKAAGLVHKVSADERPSRQGVVSTATENTHRSLSRHLRRTLAETFPERRESDRALVSAAGQLTDKRKPRHRRRRPHSRRNTTKSPPTLNGGGKASTLHEMKRRRPNAIARGRSTQARLYENPNFLHILN